MHRSLFYSETSFGSLAWISGAGNRIYARSSFLVDDLSGDACVALPASGAQWFMINHFDPEMTAEPGYFFIRILYNFSEQGSAEPSRKGIHVDRNANWFDDAGRPLPSVYARENPLLAPADFFALHDIAPSGEAATRLKLEQSIGPWHAKPSPTSDGSWADRDLLGAVSRAYSGAQTAAVSARLIRFVPNSAGRSSEPVIFWLDPRGATSATILIDAPRNEYVGAKRNYTVRFGGSCP